jgi:hypothetical protein
MVIVVDSDQVAELQMSSSRSGFTCNAFHSTAIAEESVGVVVDEFIARLVEDSGSVRLGNGQTNCVAESLTKGASCNLDTGSVMSFRVARGYAVDLLLWISIGQ